MCLCLESFTYTHQATSPVFAYGLGYDSTNYSTWAESELVHCIYTYTAITVDYLSVSSHTPSRSVCFPLHVRRYVSA